MTGLSPLAEKTPETGDIVRWGVAGVAILVGLIFLGLYASLFGLWIQTLAAKAPVSIVRLIGMKLRKVSPQIIVLCRIQAVRAGLDIPVDDIEKHYLAGGRPVDVVRALIIANRANIEMTWESATAIDLAGHDVLEVVQDAKDTQSPQPLDRLVRIVFRDQSVYIE